MLSKLCSAWIGLFVTSQLCVGAPAAAQTGWGECDLNTPIWLQTQIRACSALIDSRRYSGGMLAEAYFRRGLAYRYLRTSDYEAALRDYDRAIEVQPTHIHARIERCWAYAILGRLPEALAECDKAIRQEPQPEAYSNRGYVNLRLGRLNDALVDYDTSIKLQSHNGSALYGRGVVKLRKGDHAGGHADMAAGRAIRPSVVEDYHEREMK